jgi:hypothetical protein
MKIQTEGFVAVGDLPNHEHYPCLACGHVPDRVMVDLFVPDLEDIPPTFAVPDSKTLAVTYRLCPRCAEHKPAPWKIRLLLLERLNARAARSKP